MIQLMTDSMMKFLVGQPSAFAQVKGSKKYPGLGGMVTFYDFQEGAIVMADICGLPGGEGACGSSFYGFHIHEGSNCTGTDESPFADAGGHYNPGECPHPEHAGDMPVLEGSRGRAWMAFYTERFRPEELRGRTVIIHRLPDDYRTQPSGDSGEMIACGMIQ